MKKILSIAFGLVLVLGLVGCETENLAKKNPLICAEDVKQCPDGTFVERAGPNCEFAPCPKVKDIENFPREVGHGAKKCKEGDRQKCITSPNGSKVCVADAIHICRNGEWQIEETIPNPIKDNDEKICTMEYSPVCGQPPIPECLKKMLCKMPTPLPKTYSNKCLMESDGAEFLYEGQCQDKIPRNFEIPENCVSWFDGCNTCGVENGQLKYCTKRACRENPDGARCLKFK